MKASQSNWRCVHESQALRIEAQEALLTETVVQAHLDVVYDAAYWVIMFDTSTRHACWTPATAPPAMQATPQEVTPSTSTTMFANPL